MLPAIFALGIGICENTPRTYDPPRFVHEAEQMFAIPATQEWCEPVEDGGTSDSRRGKVWFVELRDATGSVRTILATGRAQAKRIEAMFAGTTVELVPNIEAALKAKGFTRVVPRTAICRARTTWKRGDAGGGWRTGTLAVEVIGAGHERVVRADAGTVAEHRRSEVAITAHFSRAVVLVFARLPQCGGPPPGYFGPDDGGDCYASDDVAIHGFPATQLAACFP